MHKTQIHEGNTIVTREVKGITVTGIVVSTRGTKKCSVRDENGTLWQVPYSLIIACSQDVKPIEIVKAKVGDVIQIKNGQKFRIDKVNTSRYATTRLSDGAPVPVPFTYSFVIVDEKKVEAKGKTTDKKEAQKAFLVRKGFSAKDVAEFEALFLS
jgi:ribosomal protein S17